MNPINNPSTNPVNQSNSNSKAQPTQNPTTKKISGLDKPLDKTGDGPPLGNDIFGEILSRLAPYERGQFARASRATNDMAKRATHQAIYTELKELLALVKENIKLDSLSNSGIQEFDNLFVSDIDDAKSKYPKLFSKFDSDIFFVIKDQGLALKIAHAFLNPLQLRDTYSSQSMNVFKTSFTEKEEKIREQTKSKFKFFNLDVIPQKMFALQGILRILKSEKSPNVMANEFLLDITAQPHLWDIQMNEYLKLYLKSAIMAIDTKALDYKVNEKSIKTKLTQIKKSYPEVVKTIILDNASNESRPVLLKMLGLQQSGVGNTLHTINGLIGKILNIFSRNK